MNWILDEVKETIKNQITICENFMEVCNTQIKNIYLVGLKIKKIIVTYFQVE